MAQALAELIASHPVRGISNSVFSDCSGENASEESTITVQGLAEVLQENQNLREERK
jgi:hypothetical protein